MHTPIVKKSEKNTKPLGFQLLFQGFLHVICFPSLFYETPQIGAFFIKKELFATNFELFSLS